MKRNVLLTVSLLALVGLLLATCDTGSTGSSRPEITITAQSAATTNVTVGNISGSLSVSASVTEGATLSYQWFSNTSASNVGGSELPGMTGTNFVIPTTLTVGTHFFFVEVRASGGAAPVRSTVMVVTVSAPSIPVITITMQPAALTTAAEGSITGSLSVEASVTEGATLSYQWFETNQTSNEHGLPITSATSASFAIPTDLTEGIHFFFVEVRTAGEAAPVRSTVAVVMVSAPGTPVITIITQPAPATNVVAGNITGSLSVEASVTEGAILSYQWFSNTTNSTTSGYSSIANATSASFTLPTNLAVGTHYFFAQATADGATPVRSNVAVVTVIPSILMPLDPPTNVMLTQSGAISFTPGANNAEAGGVSFTYTLFRGEEAVTGFIDQSIASGGATVTALVNAMLTLEGAHTVRVTARTGTAGFTPASSASASNVVDVFAVHVTISGGNGSDMVSVSGQNHTATFTTRVFGAATVTLTAAPAAFRLVTWSGAGNTVGNTRTITDISANVAVTAEFTAPVITFTQHPATPINVVVGSSGSLSVAASVTGGGMVSFQWFSNTTNSNTSGYTAVTGVTPSASFTLPTNLAVGRHYFFAQATAAGAAPVRSTVATVVVRPPPLPVEMVRVQGGSFERGRELGTAGGFPPLGGDTNPVYTITISAFYLGRYQVTREQWTAVMTGNPNGISATNPSWSIWSANAQEASAGFYMNRRPVTHVSWYDAMVFSNRLSIQRGLTPAYELPNQWPGATSWSNDPDTWGTVPTSGNARWFNVRIAPGSTGYRLPTEAQWEFAAKGGNVPGPYTFAGSNTATAVGWILDNSETSSRMVGLLPANSLGLHDMTGNVWEWVWDWFGTYTATPSTDPVGASSGPDRVIRGGDFSSTDADFARSVRRNSNGSSNRWGFLGFRVSRP